MMAEADMYIIIIFRKTSLKVYYNIKNKMFNKMQGIFYEYIPYYFINSSIK